MDRVTEIIIIGFESSDVVVQILLVFWFVSLSLFCGSVTYEFINYIIKQVKNKKRIFKMN